MSSSRESLDRARRRPLAARGMWSAPESWSCDEMVEAEIMATFEQEFGERSYSVPSGPVFHQRLMTDVDLDNLRGRAR
jgi:hypothetical protein